MVKMPTQEERNAEQWAALTRFFAQPGFDFLEYVVSSRPLALSLGAPD